MAGFLTGEESSINSISCLKEWRIVDLTDPPKARCSNSKGGTVVGQGNNDWYGLARAYGGQPGVLPGSKFTFGGAARNGKGGSGLAICDQIIVYWDVEGANLLYYDCFFSGRGALTYGNPSMSAITGLPAPTSAKGLYATLDGSDWAIRKGKLTVRCINAEYNDSSTAGQTGREPGNFEADFEIDIYHNDFVFPTKGNYYTVALETVVGGATGNWRMNYAEITELGPEVKVEGGRDGRPEGIHSSIKGEWSMVYGTNEGTIIAPDDTVIWPFTYGT